MCYIYTIIYVICNYKIYMYIYNENELYILYIYIYICVCVCYFLETVDL